MTLSSLDRVISVAELNRQARSILEASLPLMWISGEISNLTVASSGHLYFTLKDGQAQVRSVMFRMRAALLPFRPQEGLKVEVRAQVSLYEARGDYQLQVEAMRLAGVGALYEAFEHLKLTLSREGLFDAARKRTLPRFPRRIGIVTSPQAAALQDVLSVLRARAPHVQAVLYPVPVQGVGAAEKIAAMLARASERREVDVLLLVRGGGSIEDLWSFNEEIVARSIASCAIPVIAGVGHETDTTIADFVADVRAPTPTAAATLVSQPRDLLMSRIADQAGRMRRTWMRQMQSHLLRVDHLARRLVSPRQRLLLQGERLMGAQARLQRRMAHILEQRRWQFAALHFRYKEGRPQLDMKIHLLQQMQARRLMAAQRTLRTHSTLIAHMGARLAALNPEAVLQRGYAIVRHPDGSIRRSPDEVRAGDPVSIRLATGEVHARIDVPMGQGQLEL